MKYQTSVLLFPYTTLKNICPGAYSLMAQNDFTNWEAICIDDGSSDRSGEILDTYAIRDSRFRIVHQKSEGVSSARNKGISLATAPYLMFIDFDDWIEQNMFRVLYDTINRDQSDMVVCGYFYDSIHEGAGRRYPLISEYRWDKLIYGWQLVTGNLIRFITPYLWNKIFKREIIVKNSLSFEEDISFGEDHAFSC